MSLRTTIGTNIVGSASNTPRQWNPPNTLVQPEAARYWTVDLEALKRLQDSR
jgi:hypothetical protein